MLLSSLMYILTFVRRPLMFFRNDTSVAKLFYKAFWYYFFTFGLFLLAGGASYLLERRGSNPNKYSLMISFTLSL